MGKVFKNLEMVIHIKVCIKMVNLQDMVNIIGQLVVILKEFLVMV